MSLSKLRFLGVALLLTASFALAVPTTVHATRFGALSQRAGQAAQHEGWFARLLHLLMGSGATMDPNGNPTGNH